MLVCPICNKEYMSDLSPHIIRIHKICIIDFKKLYPNYTYIL
jgi:hypothetical protein